MNNQRKTFNCDFPLGKMKPRYMCPLASWSGLPDRQHQGKDAKSVPSRSPPASRILDSATPSVSTNIKANAFRIDNLEVDAFKSKSVL